MSAKVVLISNNLYWTRIFTNAFQCMNRANKYKHCISPVPLPRNKTFIAIKSGVGIVKLWFIPAFHKNNKVCASVQRSNIQVRVYDIKYFAISYFSANKKNICKHLNPVTNALWSSVFLLAEPTYLFVTACLICLRCTFPQVSKKQRGIESSFFFMSETPKKAYVYCDKYCDTSAKHTVFNCKVV